MNWRRNNRNSPGKLGGGDTIHRGGETFTGEYHPGRQYSLVKIVQPDIIH